MHYRLRGTSTYGLHGPRKMNIQPTELHSNERYVPLTFTLVVLVLVVVVVVVVLVVVIVAAVLVAVVAAAVPR